VSGHDQQAYVPVFTGETLAELERLGERYPTRRALLLPALWMVQKNIGWVPPEAVHEVATLLDVTPADVYGVLTFYTMYHQHPTGRNVIQVCTTSPCNMCGAEDVVRKLLDETGCGELGAISPDGRFSVVEVECLGACGFATPMLINDDFIESVTPDRVAELLARYP
jgi:NADH dehydrogenase (ubiquinone) flavoprotein 2